MDLNSQTREASVEEWWAALHGSDQPVDGIGADELLGQAGLLGLVPRQFAEMAMLGVDCRANPEANTQVSQASEAAGLHLLTNAFSPSLERQTYGSNEDVYNPYNPLASKEYLAQEAAAGRIEPTATPQKPPRTSHKTQRPTLGSLPGLANRENIFANSLRDEVLYRSGRDQALSLGATDSEGSTDEGAGDSRSDALPGLTRDIVRSSARSRRRRGSLTSLGIEIEADPYSEDVSGIDFPGLASPLEFGDFNFSSGDIQTPGMGSFRPRRMRAADPAATANGLLWGTSSNISTASTELAGSSTLQPAAGAVEWAALADHHRKRRRITGSPQEVVPPPPVPGTIGAARTAARRADTSVSVTSPIRPFLRAEAPVFVPRSAPSISGPPLGGQPIDVGRILPENIRLTIDRHLNQHPTTTTPIKTSSVTFSPTNIAMRHLVYTSELIPASFGKRKRRTILNILRAKAPYVPICIAAPPMRPKIQYHLSLKPKRNVDLSRSDGNDAPLGSNSQGWPVAPYGGLPLEVFQNIARYLPRSALESLRLVNREFERNVSNVQFRKVVVPFRPEIYDILDPRGPLLKVGDVKGNAKEKEMPLEQNETAKAVHDGMKVFEAWGSEVKEFAMAFEATDDQLVKPPVKGKFEIFDAFFGSYKWPHPDYRRFELLCGLEKKADEHRYMSTALSNLRDVQVLGLCIDNGLGWISGPDISDRAQVFNQKTTIFGARQSETEAKLSEGNQTWKGIVRSLRPEDGSNYRVEGEMICHGELPMTPDEHGFYQAIVYPRRSSPRVEFVCHPDTTCRPLVFQGINVANAQPATITTPPINLLDLSQGNKETPFMNAPIIPTKLTVPQKEWLMETEWAQRAFLSSYCMALTDNSLTFQHVHTLNIAKLSSKHLGALERDDFWTALPNLSKLILNVAADFRAISKNDSGEVVADDIDPSVAAFQFFILLRDYISKAKSINTMSLGYCGGGERQTGIFGRNKFVFPAPLADYTNHNVFDRSFRRVLFLPYVRHLTLTNCWIAPPILKTLVSVTRCAKLRSLTLDSVSLSAHSGILDATLPDPLQNGVYASPVGHPLRFASDPILGDFFAQRDSQADPANADPVPGSLDSWVRTAGRVGSWADVIDSISPGPTLDLVRYAFRYLEDPPERRKPGFLEVINFISCGYIRLVNQPADFLDQSCLPEVTNSPPPCLRKRALDLMPVMMHRNTDRLLGQIVPALPELDDSVFETGFPMTIGWPDEEGLDALEDGQPLGGDARFTGKVEKLRFDES